MAITKIIAIRDRLDKRINYAVNGEKTTLDAGITYTTNPEKTEQHFFTSALNCEICETAYTEMQATKRRFGKLGGVVGNRPTPSARSLPGAYLATATRWSSAPTWIRPICTIMWW